MNTIPRIPDKMRRINLAIDWELWKRALNLKIDVHEFFRWKLQEAVEYLENEHDLSGIQLAPDSSKDTFFDAMGGLREQSRDSCGDGLDGKITERIKAAARRIE